MPEIKSAYKIWKNNTTGIDFRDNFEKELIDDRAALKLYIEDLTNGVDKAEALKNQLSKGSIAAHKFVKDKDAKDINLDKYDTFARREEITSIASDHSFSNSARLIHEYNSALEENRNGITKCGLAQSDLVDSISKSNKGLGDYLKGLNGGKAGLIGYGKQLVATKLKTIALQAQTMLLNMAISAGIMLIVNGIALAYDKLANKAENAKNRLSELNDEISSNETELETLEGELATINEEIEKLLSFGTLSFSDKNELQTLKAERIELERKVALLEREQEIAKSEKKTKFAEAFDEDINKSWKSGNSFGDKLLNFMTGITEKEFIDTQMSLFEGANKAISQYESKLSGGNLTEIDRNGYEQYLKIAEQDAKSSSEYLNAKIQELNELREGLDYVENPVAGSIDEANNKRLSYIDDLIDRWSILSNLSNAKTTTFDRLINFNFKDETEGLKQLGEQGKVTVEALNSMYNDESNTGIIAFIDKLKELGVITDTSIESLELIALAFNNPSISLDKEVSSEVASGLKTLTSEQLDIARDLENKALAAGIEVPDDVYSSWEKLKKLIDDISAKEITSSFTDAVSKVESLSTGLDQLAEIYNDVKDGGDFDYSKMLNNEDFKQSFGNLGTVYDEFIKTVTNSPKNIKACQGAFNSLTSAYINQKSALSGVTEETKSAITQALKQMGISNADAVVKRRLAGAEDAAAVAKRRLAVAEEKERISKELGTKATWNKISAMYTEAQAGSVTRQALSELIAKELALGNLQISCANEVEQILSIANAAGASAETLSTLQTVLSYFKSGGYTSENPDETRLNDLKGGNSSKRSNKAYSNEYIAGLISGLKDKLSNGEIFNSENFVVDVTFDPPSTGSTTGSGTDKEKPIDKFNKYVSKLFDWVEIRLSRLQEKTEKYFNRAEKYLEEGNYKKAEEDYRNAADYTADQIVASQKASKKYNNTAENVLDKAVNQGVISKKQAESIREKMENGTLDISKYSDDVKSVIGEYQTYYDKYLEQDKNIEGFKEQYKEYIKKLYSIPAEKASDAIEELENERSDLEAKIDIKDYAKDKNKILDQITDNAIAQLNTYKTEESEAKAALDDAWKNKNNKGIKDAKNTKYNKNKKKGEKLSLKGLKVGSDAYKAVVAYNASVDALKEASEKVSDAEVTVKKTKRDNAKTKFDNISERYDSKQSKFESNIAKSQASIQLIGKTGKSGQSSVLEELYKDIIDQNSALKNSKQEELATLRQSYEENKADMSEADRQEALNAIASVETEIIGLEGEIEDANAAIAELPFLELEKQLELLDSIGSKLSSDAALKEAKGLDLSISDYQKQIDSNIDKIENKTKTANEAYSNYLQAIVSGGAYGGKSSDQWLKEFNNAQTEINNIKVENEQLKDSLRDDVYWRTFERAHDAAKRFSDVLSGISELISDDMLFDSEGNLTEFGFSKLALDIKGMETAREEVDNYIKDIDNLNRLYSKGDHSGYSPEEYKEELAKLHAGLLDSASSVKSYTDSVVNMYKDIAKAELDSLFELIDARNEALNAKKAYYDYDKTISSKTKDIQSLQAQIAALEGVNGSEAKAKRAKLSAELEEAQEDLNDVIMDHKFELSQDALSEMKDLLQEEFDDKFKDLSSNLTEIQNVINSASDIVNSSITDVNDTIKTLLGHYGLSEEVISNLSTQDPKEDVFVNPAQQMANTVSNLMSSVLGALGITTGYASGTKYVPRKMTAWTQENGAEIIVTKHGMITPLDRGDGVVPAELTRRLYDMALGNYNVLPGVLPNHTGVPDISTSFAPNITQHYDNLINIEGSADAATVADLKKLSNDLMKKSYEYMSKKTFEDFIRSGGKRKI